MSSGLITSFAIGGLLLLSVLFLNLNINRSSTSLTMRQITQQNVQATSEFITHDFSKIGFASFKTVPDAITVADSSKIIFKSDIDNSGSTETVEWFWNTSAPLASTPNPDDYLLQRKVDGSKTDIPLGVTAFKITYRDKDKNIIPAPIGTQTERNKIRHIEVELSVSSEEQLGKLGAGGEKEYTRSSWSKTFSPKNIK